VCVCVVVVVVVGFESEVLLKTLERR
jgi:hypothetical protein